MRVKLGSTDSLRLNRGAVRTNLFNRNRIRISVINPSNEPLTGCIRLLEDGYFRLLEDGSIRILETCDDATNPSYIFSDPLNSFYIATF